MYIYVHIPKNVGTQDSVNICILHVFAYFAEIFWIFSEFQADFLHRTDGFAIDFFSDQFHSAKVNEFYLKFKHEKTKN